MWPPSSSPVVASLRSFTKPTGSAMPCALPFAVKGNFATLTSYPSPTACVLGPAEAGDLRLAEGRPGHHHEVDLHRFDAGDRLGGDDAHRLGGVREHQLGRDVADRVDVRHVRAATAIDRDLPSRVEVDTGLLDAVSGHVRREPDRLQNLFGLAGLGLAARTNVTDTRVGRLVDRLHLRAGQHVHAEAPVALGQLGLETSSSSSGTIRSRYSRMVTSTP